MSVDPAQIALSAEQRRRLAQLAERMGKDWTEVLDGLLCSAPTSIEGSEPNGEALIGKSLFDVLTERGILGCFDGPTDLSTNPKHMEGFGESRHR
jgi:hypothetical protein